MTRDKTHRYLGVEMNAQGVVAVCSCGWRSRSFSAAGLAGSAWDSHAETLETEPSTDGAAGAEESSKDA